MKNFEKILAGAAAIAAITAIASPAAAQSSPYGYGYGQPTSNGGVVGAIINSVVGGGYGQYPQGNYGYGQVDQRTAVSQCAAAAEQRINANYRGQGYGAANGYNGYQNGYGQNPYGQNAYGNAYAQGGGRVIGITSVERRGSGLRVRGIATSGAYAGQYANQGYAGQYANPYGNQYGNQYGANTAAAADLSFNCKVSLRGQVTDVRIARNQARYSRGY